MGRTLAAAFSALLLPLAAQAEPTTAAAFPNAPVRLLVPNTPGSAADVTARFVATRLAESWQQPVTVENRAGAGGIVAADAVAKSAPDGPASPVAEFHLDVAADFPVARPVYAGLHVHAHDTVGTNSPAYNAAYARDVGGIDVFGYTANDFQITDRHWTKGVEAVMGYDEPGRFVVYPVQEWCGSSTAGGATSPTGTTRNWSGWWRSPPPGAISAGSTRT